MKKTIMLFVLFFTLLIVSKYYLSNYNLNYKVDGYDVITYKNNDRIYYELKGKYTFNFDTYDTKWKTKAVITKIEEIKDDTLYCIYPVIKNIKTHPLCIYNETFTDFNFIDSELLVKYKEEIVDVDKKKGDFVYYNYLNNDTYAAIWNYKGYYVMHGSSYENYTLIEKDKYDNSLAYMRKNFIYMPNYDQEHVFDEILEFNIFTGEHEILELDYELDYDSYIVGEVNKRLYIFDNKHSVLYSYRFANGKLEIVSNNTKGFVKYKNGEFITCSKSEYKNDKITYTDVNKKHTYNYYSNNGIYKTISNNKNIKELILDSASKPISEHLNQLYYIKDNTLYLYDPLLGSNKVFYYYELNFNKDNKVFMYYK